MTLLDAVNILIALIDPTYVCHGNTHQWFAQDKATRTGRTV